MSTLTTRPAAEYRCAAHPSLVQSRLAAKASKISNALCFLILASFPNANALLPACVLGSTTAGLRFPLRPSQPEGLPIELSVVLSQLLDLDELVLAHVQESLARVAGWPPDFQVRDARGLAQPDVLFQRRCAKRAATAYRAVN